MKDAETATAIASKRSPCTTTMWGSTLQPGAGRCETLHGIDGFRANGLPRQDIRNLGQRETDALDHSSLVTTSHNAVQLGSNWPSIVHHLEDEFPGSVFESFACFGRTSFQVLPKSSSKWEPMITTEHCQQTLFGEIRALELH